MDNKSEEYNKILKWLMKMPDYIKETYNVNFATSKHATKISLKSK